MHLQVEASHFSQHEIQPCTPLHLRLPTQTSRRFPTKTGFFDMLRLYSKTNSLSSIRLSLKASRSMILTSLNEAISVRNVFYSNMEEMCKDSLKFILTLVSRRRGRLKFTLSLLLCVIAFP